MAETFTAAEKRRAIKRELALRNRLYPSMIAREKLTQADADREVALMTAILADYDRIVGQEQTKVAPRPLPFEPVDIFGPVPFSTMRDTIMKLVEAAQMVGDLPKRHDEPVPHAAVVWIGPADEPHGFAVFMETYPKVAWLDLLYVQPQYRSQGHGALLMQCFEQCLLSDGFQSAELGTDMENLRMQRLALRLGWEKHGIMMERKL